MNAVGDINVNLSINENPQKALLVGYLSDLPEFCCCAL